MRLILTILAAVLCAGARSFAEAKPESTIQVGGRTIKVPAPSGYVRCDGVLASWDSMRENFLPATNRSLAFYGSEADLQKLNEQEMPDVARNLNIQVVRSVESMEVGQRTFAGAKGEMKQGLDELASQLASQVEKLSKEGSARMSKELKVDVALTLSNAVFLGYFQDTDSSFGFTMVIKGSVKTPGLDEKLEPSVVAAVMTPVNGRLLNFYCTLPYTGDGKADRKLAEETVSGWAAAVVAANPQIAGPPAKKSLFENSLKFALIGGAIGGVVALLNLLKKRKSA